MVDRHLLREFDIDDAELEAILSGDIDLDEEIQKEAKTYDINDILNGTVVRVDDEEVIVDIGYKSEGKAITLKQSPADLNELVDAANLPSDIQAKWKKVIAESHWDPDRYVYLR